jgi:hypothetical protein
VLQLPERIEFIDAMPYTGAQKTDKRFLQEDDIVQRSSRDEICRADFIQRPFRGFIFLL